MTAYPTSQSDFDADVKKMTPKVTKVSGKITECREEVDKAKPPHSGGLLGTLGKIGLSAVFPIAGFYFGAKEVEHILKNTPQVKEKLDEAQGHVEDMVAELGRLVSPGNPFAMTAAADQWDAVNRTLTGILAPLDKFSATSSWTDEMGARYSKVPEGQKAAVEGLLPHVSGMATYMREHAASIVQLWWDIYLEILDFVSTVLPHAASFLSANPLKWLEVAEKIAQIVSDILTAVRNLVDKVFTFTTGSNSAIQQLKAATSDVTGTDFGAWPKARLV